jgi:hypothetical protein
VCRSVSTAAQVQNARSSSPVASLTLGTLGVVDPHPRHGVARPFGAMHGPVPDRERAPGSVASAACRQAAVASRSSSTRLWSIARRGSRSRVRWSIRDLRERISFCRARSSGADRTRRGPRSPPAQDPPSPTVRCRGKRHAPPPRRPWRPLVVRRPRSPHRCLQRSSGLHQHALLPGCGDLGCQTQRGNTGVVAFQIAPEQPSQVERARFRSVVWSSIGWRSAR